MSVGLLERKISNIRVDQFLVATFLLLVFVGLKPLADPYLNQLEKSGDGDMSRQVGFIFIFLSLLAATMQRSDTRQRLCIPKSFIILLVWCWFSLFWAIEPTIGFRRVTLTTMIALCSFMSVSLVGAERFIRILAITLATVVLVDWLAVLLHPNAVHTFGETDEALVGNWRGVHSDKNLAGAIHGIAAIVCIFTFLQYRSLGYIFAAFASLMFLFKTQSKTSMLLTPIAVVAALAFYFLFRSKKAQYITLLLVSLTIIGGAIEIVDRIPELIAVLEDPAALTGRTQIWNVLIQYASDHLALGSGYGSFWNIGSYSPVDNYGGWIDGVYEGHNGYLDVLVQTGCIGLALTIVALIIVPVAGLLRSTDESRNCMKSLALAIVIFSMLHNLLETSFLDRDNPTWVMVLFALSLLRTSAPPSST
jgi:O-antigen ligase